MVNKSFPPENFAAISDGASNTLMVGEYTPRMSRLFGMQIRTFWAYTYASYNQSSFSLLPQTYTNDFNSCFNADAGTPYTDQPCKRAWGSNHTGNGLNVLLCDGSVRWLAYSTDLRVVNAMATIDGGEPAVGNN